MNKRKNLAKIDRLTDGWLAGYIHICVTIHEKVPSLSSRVRASATYVNDF